MKTVLPPGPRDHWFGLAQLRAMQEDFVGYWRKQHRRYGRSRAVAARRGEQGSMSFPLMRPGAGFFARIDGTIATLHEKILALD